MSIAIGISSVPGTTNPSGTFNSTPSGTAFTETESVGSLAKSPPPNSASVPPSPTLTALTFRRTGSSPVEKLLGNFIKAEKSSFGLFSVCTANINLSKAGLLGLISAMNSPMRFPSESTSCISVITFSSSISISFRPTR